MNIDVFGLALKYELLPPHRDDLYFIQVGAHDGHTLDPIVEYVPFFRGGLLVEPNAAIFEKLVKLYEGNAGLRFENVAIAFEDGTAPIYRFKPGQGLPYHETMLTSMFKTIVEGNSHGYKGQVEEVSVPCMTPATLLAKHPWAKDAVLLQIDAEGMDIYIIAGFLHAGCEPTLIHFENPHCFNMPKELIKSVTDALEAKGYLFHTSGIDCLAYKQTMSAGTRRRLTATYEDMRKAEAP